MLSETWIEELADDFRAMGVEGRHVMPHSSFRVLRPVENGPAGVVEAMVQAVGMGVLVIPTFDFESFSERGYWNRQESPSRMGAISEAARTDSRFVRSSHPMLSFAVRDPDHGIIRETYPLGRIGPLRSSGVSPYLEEGQYGYFTPVNAHGAGSVFDRFIQNDGLLLSFSGEGFRPGGVDVGFTLSVHSAVIAEVDWRYTKVFEGTYIDNGIASIRKYSASVCRRDRFVTEVTPAHEAAEREGVITRHKLGRAECLRAEALTFHEWAVESHRKSPELWRREL